jgi:hypothetical protein
MSTNHRLVEVKNIKVVHNEDTAKEYVHYFTVLSNLEIVIMDENTDEDETKFFVRFSLRHMSAKSAQFDTHEEALACYQAFMEVMKSDDGSFHSIDLKSFVR